MKHDMAKQAANELASKEIEKYHFDQRISLAVVMVGGEEGSIDALAMSGIWPRDFCGPRIFVKATLFSLSARVVDSGEERGGCTRSPSKKIP